MVTEGESTMPISLIFYADAISLLINAIKTVGCTEPFEQIARTRFTYIGTFDMSFWKTSQSFLLNPVDSSQNVPPPTLQS